MLVGKSELFIAQGVRMRRILAVLVPAAALVGVLAAPATADPQPIHAPYAQAAAKVSASGELTKAKHVISVTKPDTGTYCVKVDRRIDLSESVVQATASYWYTAIAAYAHPTKVCGNKANTVLVRTTKVNGSTTELKDAAFYLTIP
jgi:hypothetical protein